MTKEPVTSEDLKYLLQLGEGHTLVALPPFFMPVSIDSIHIPALVNAFDESVVLVSYERLMAMAEDFDELVLMSVVLDEISELISS